MKRKEGSSKQNHYNPTELDFLFTQRQSYYIYTYLLASYQVRTNLSTDYVMLILHIKDDPAGSQPFSLKIDKYVSLVQDTGAFLWVALSTFQAKIICSTVNSSNVEYRVL